MDEQVQTLEQAAAEWESVAQERESGKAPTDSTPATPPSNEPAAATAEPSAPADVQTTEPADPYAGLSPEVREKLKRFDELATQVPNLVQGLNEAKGRIGALQSELAKSKQTAPTAAQVAAADPEKWAALKRDFPEWGDGIEARLQQITNSFAGQGLTADQLSEKIAEANEAIRKEYQEDLVSMFHPTWREDVNSEPFGKWYGQQSAEIQALARSDKGQDAVKMLNMFHESQKKPTVSVKEERQQRLANAVTSKPGTAAVTKTFEDMSAKEQWDFMAAQRERQAAQN